MSCYIEHRREVVLRRTRFLLQQAEVEAEKLEGYLIALANLDEFIKIIRDSRDRDDAKAKLLALSWTRKAVEQIGILMRDEARIVEGRYRFTEKQVGHILDLRLYQLTGLERESIQKRIRYPARNNQRSFDIIAKEARVLKIIKTELRAIQKQAWSRAAHADRPSAEGEMAIEDLIANEGVIVTLTHNGFIKRTAG